MGATLGLGSGPRCFIRGCLRCTRALVLFVLLSLRFLPGFFILFFYFFFLNFHPAPGFCQASSAQPASPARHSPHSPAQPLAQRPSPATDPP